MVVTKEKYPHEIGYSIIVIGFQDSKNGKGKLDKEISQVLGSPLLDDAAHDTKGVMDGTVCLFDDELVGPSHEDADCLRARRCTEDLDDLGATDRDLLNKIGRPEHVCCHAIGVGDGLASQTLHVSGHQKKQNHLANKVDLITLDILDDHDFHLGQKVQCKITNSIARQ